LIKRLVDKEIFKNSKKNNRIGALPDSYLIVINQILILWQSQSEARDKKQMMEDNE